MQGAGDQRQRPGRPRRDHLVAGPEPHAPVVVADHRQVHLWCHRGSGVGAVDFSPPKNNPTVLPIDDL